MHWSTQYLGKPWVSGARGPDAFDCWGLVRWIYSKQLGIRLPSYPGIDAKDKETVSALIKSQTCVGPFASEWHRLTKPEDLCGVAMGLTDLTHCGIYLAVDGGVVLHTASRHNCIAQSLARLKADGFARIEFYQHGSHR